MYLILDTLISSEKSNEIQIHHGIGILITLLGLRLLDTSSSYTIVPNTVKTLLHMEITNPLLHGAWMLKQNGNNIESIVVFILLVAAWIPFRIIYPIGAFINFINYLI
jgi:hypothetical protein